LESATLVPNKTRLKPSSPSFARSLIITKNDLFHILDKFVDSFGKMIFLKSLDVFAKKIKEEGC